MPDLPDDPALLDTATDVVRRLNSFGSYGSLQGARKALARRCPGRAETDYARVLEYLDSLYAIARNAVDSYQVSKPNSKRKRVSRFEDIDFDRCLAELDRARPGYAVAAKTEILSWVIQWHYLR